MVLKHFYKLKKDKRKRRLRNRFCSRCGEIYKATGKYSRICPKCNKSGDHWKKKRSEEKDLNKIKKERNNKKSKGE